MREMMEDAYSGKNLNLQSSKNVPPKADQFRFPEIIESDDVGRAYPVSKPLSIRATLRRWFLK